MIFLVSTVFIFLFYVIPLHLVVLDRPPIFPVLGSEGSWLLTAFFIYSFMGLAALTVTRFEEVLWPSLPAFREKITRRTGIHRFDSFGRRVSILAVILFLGTDPVLVPLGVAAALGFWSLTRYPVAVRTVAPDPASTGSKDSKPKTAPDGDDGEIAVHVFKWQMDDEGGGTIRNRLELPIDKHQYEEFHRANPANLGAVKVNDYPHLVLDGLTEELTVLARKIRKVANERGFNRYQEISLVLAFVQSIPGAPEARRRGRKYTRWPIETLYENIGGSGCKTVLLAAVIKVLGYPIVILESNGHTAVGVGGADGIPGRFLTYRGYKYYYCEPDIAGTPVGQIPDDLTADQLFAYDVREAPHSS